MRDFSLGELPPQCQERPPVAAEPALAGEEYGGRDAGLPAGATGSAAPVRGCAVGPHDRAAATDLINGHLARSEKCRTRTSGRFRIDPYSTRPIASQFAEMVMPTPAGNLRSGCDCHRPQRQPACLNYRAGNLRDRYRRVNVANPRP
jgi:hypothetical protein